MEPVAQVDQGTVTNLHSDHLYTPRLGTDSTQATVWQWESPAFGNAEPQIEGVVVNLRFPGQYFDAESGLYYNWNRYYDPELGRYVTSDPIGLVGGLNTYGYVDGNPLKFADPSGLNPDMILIMDPALYYKARAEQLGYDPYTMEGADATAKVVAEEALYDLIGFGLGMGMGRLAGTMCRATPRSVHGNSAQSTKSQHGYEIVDTKTGNVCKLGISGCALNKNGSSPRANSQANKWNKEPGNAGRYEPRVVKQVSEGEGARKKILKWEQQRAAKLRKQLDPARHTRP